MGRGLGPLQQAILAELHDPAENVWLITSELAQRCLGRQDTEATRQVRRAVDSLARRGLVVTSVGSVEQSVHGMSDDMRSRRSRRYLRNGWVVTAAKSRVRWVCFAFDARPFDEQLALIERWLDECKAALAKYDEPPPEGPLTGRWRYDGLVAEVQHLEAQRTSLLDE